jgi:hypothetical protein
MQQSQSMPTQASTDESALQSLSQYRGCWIAFSADGRVLARAKTLANLEAKLRLAGEDPEDVLLERIPSGNSIVSGSDLS